MIIAHDGTRYWHVINFQGHFPAAFVMSDETARGYLHDAKPYPWPQLAEMIAKTTDIASDITTTKDGDQYITIIRGYTNRQVVVAERWRADVEACATFDHWRLGDLWAVAFDARGMPIAIVMGMREVS